MIVWISRHQHFHPDMLGYVADMIDESDPRDAKTQLDAAYGFGGFWMGADQGVRLGDGDAMLFPEDPPQYPLAEARLRDERVLFYPHEFIGVIAADGSFSVQHMD